MKIAHFIINLGKGGGQRSTIDLIRSTSDKVDNYLILLENKRAYEVSDIKTFSLCQERKIYKQLDILGDYLLSKKLDRLLKELKIDLVISHMEATAKVLRFLNIPKIYYMRVDITQELNSFKEKSFLRYIKRKNLYKNIFDNQNLITISQDTEKNLLNFINPKKIQTIYNPFDLERVMRLSNEPAILPSEDYLIQIGSDFKRKRQDILLEAFSKIKDKKIKLLLLGTEENKQILEWIKRLGIKKERIIFQPFTANPYPFIKNAKMLIMSSEREGLPRVIVESLILKTPVVSTDCDTGPREILVDELGVYLAKVNDPNDLANKINLALKSYPEITDKYIKKFDKNEIIKKYLFFTGNLIKNNIN
ncbi:MAG: glycosyltransferase [Sulfurovaceae bacterium]|nr:glycosyltransferase [Sulfurovaceae bacterium]